MSPSRLTGLRYLCNRIGQGPIFFDCYWFSVPERAPIATLPRLHKKNRDTGCRQDVRTRQDAWDRAALHGAGRRAGGCLSRHEPAAPGLQCGGGAPVSALFPNCFRRHPRTAGIPSPSLSPPPSLHPPLFCRPVHSIAGTGPTGEQQASACEPQVFLLTQGKRGKRRF